ncbi:hypothetical protein [Pelagicoccus sp. SDUM812003]|uniref:hypothetical protein n=1 Tax=Pelagicoccus sp. SDUM812003 TaxID=3041267 RepID=UPI00281105F8|nr:hypothetical protein [Pelagicoccus sp. SDUM812003]
MAVAIGLVLAACETLEQAGMKLPNALAQEERQPVTGRQGWKLDQQLRFADIEVLEVQRGITKGGDLRILEYDQSRRKQLYSFVLFDQQGQEWIGDCEAFLRRRQLTFEVGIELQNRSMLGARFSRQGGSADVWELRLKESGDKPLQGTLVSGSRQLEVSGTRALAGSPLPLDETTGYVISLGGEALAAAEVINDGAVWVSSTLDDELKGPVSSCLAALLLFEELRVTLDE